MKKLGILIAAMLLVFAACEKEAEPVTVEFKSQTYSMSVGQTMELAGEVKVSNSNKKPSFSSSNAAVVTVDKNGNVTAVAQGTATVKAEVEGKSASCTVNVSDVKASKITLTAPQSLPADESWATVTAEVEPVGFNKDNLVWTFAPSNEALEFETEKINGASYRVRFMSFVEDATLEVKVADKNSDVQKAAVIGVTEKVVVATRISLSMPKELTEGEVWASVTASVVPEDYNTENLVWEFTPSSEELGFKSEKVSATEYKVCFTKYVADGNVIIKVTDALSTVFNQDKIKVLEKPAAGVTKLTLSPVELALNTDAEPVTLQISYEPESYDASLLEWSTSNDEVATVDKGVVTVVGEGSAVIKVKDTVSGKEASCAVTVTTPVKEAVVTRIDISQTNLTMRVGEEAVQLTATCYDEDGNVVENYAELEWSADQMDAEDGKKVNVVEVSQQGVVTPKNPGTTQVYVKNRKNTNVKAICNVTVYAAEVKVEEVRLEPSSKVIEEGQIFVLKAIVTPENAENKTLAFTSSNESVATVSADGTVTAIAAGEAVITATSSNGIKGTCRVTVAEESWVYLSDEEITLVVGDEKTLTATVTPEDAPDKTVTWASSAPDVASVDAGKVKALKEGAAVITATAANGKSAQCKVNVEAAAVEFEITLSTTEQSVMTKGLQQDKTFRLYAKYIRKKDGKEHTPASTSWRSSDESIAIVDAEGNVTAVIEHIEQSGYANGKKVTITHVADGKEKSVEIAVVKAMPEQIVLTSVPSVDGQEYKMIHGESFTFTAKVLPEKASQDFHLQSSATGVAFIEGGVFKASYPGLVNFTAYAADNTDVRCHFSVEVLPVPATAMMMSNTALDMTVGTQASLTAEVLPANASYKTLEWSSSDENIVSVDQHGLLTANAAGTVVITAFQKENNLTATCEVTVSAPATSVNVGDYYYSDGTTSSTLDATKTVIGVVFSLNNPVQMGDAKLAADFPECTHGYVVSTVEYIDQDFGNVSSYYGHGYYNGIGYDANLIVDTEKANGYGNTLAHRDLNAAKPDYVSLYNATTGVLAVHTSAVPVPSTASAWYIPSYKEMLMMTENMEDVNSALAAAGGTPIAEPYASDASYDENRASDWYWTSTIHGTWYESGKSYDHSKYPFDISRNSWTSYTQTFAKCNLRVVLAF